MFNIAAAELSARRGKFKHVQCHGVESRRENCRRPQWTSRRRGYTRVEPLSFSPSPTPGDPARVTLLLLFYHSGRYDPDWNRSRERGSSIAGVLGPGRPLLIVGGHLQVRLLLTRQTRMHKPHLMMVMVVVMVVVLMTRRRRRIGVHSDGDIHDVYLRRYDDGRRLRRGLHLLRATDRVATSFTASSRPTYLTFPNGRAAVAGGRGCRRRNARRFHDLVPVRFAHRRAGQQIIPEIANAHTGCHISVLGFLSPYRCLSVVVIIPMTSEARKHVLEILIKYSLHFSELHSQNRVIT